jgi:hypothetical protein
VSLGGRSSLRLPGHHLRGSTPETGCCLKLSKDSLCAQFKHANLILRAASPGFISAPVKPCAMPISPKEYAARPAELEDLASAVSDPAIRKGYLELAAELRRFAEPALPLSNHTDEQIQRRPSASSAAAILPRAIPFALDSPSGITASAFANITSRSPVWIRKQR